jgi:hypothetical protein
MQRIEECGFMELDVTFRIVLEKPTMGVDFGLQKGKGSAYETVQTQRSAGKDLTFEFTSKFNDDRNEAMPKIRGPFIQGPVTERFVYIDIGTCAGQQDSCWSRRLKVPLNGITWKMIDRALVEPNAILEARVPGTGKGGGPNCATVKPFNGWNVAHHKSQ